MALFQGNNVVVDGNGVAKLTDFGMSFLYGSGTVHVGPARWTAPESLIRGEIPSFQLDTYSLSMCIIEAATGIVPWSVRREDADVRYELTHRRFVAQPEKLNDIQWELVTSLCAFDPMQRCTLSVAIDQLNAFADAEAEAERR